MQSVFLLLGSNLGDRRLFLETAADRINAIAGQVLRKSAIYETQSWGKSNAPDYLNQVLLVQSDLPAKQLLDVLLEIEQELGRRREERYGSRTIDIDILFYGQDIISESNLNVPHPELHKRRFTLEPLAEIAPYFMHPTLKKNILELKTELIDDLHVKRYNFEEDHNEHMLQNPIPQDLDLSTLEEIADGSNEFLVESIDLFLQQTPELLKMIANGLAAEDWVTVAAAAHKLKPNLGFFGMPISQGMMQEVELMAKAGAPSPDELNTKFIDVEAIIVDNIVSLRKIRAEKEAQL
jgi:2-amino-4-hydroxy-6-hydroxymethyldihydropteridine diphosphokinase